MRIERLPTNSPLDKILDGGIEYGVVTNIYGPAGSGKTNVCLSALTSVKNKKIIYIDTEASFSAERLVQMTKDESVLKRLLLFEPKTWEEQLKAVKELEGMVKKEHVGLVIIDSIVSLYRLEINDQNFSEINRQLATVYSILSKIAREHNLPVLVTNQIYIAGEEVELTSKTIALYWSKALVELQKTDRPNHRMAIVRKHRSLPEGRSVEIKITEHGLEEAGKMSLF